MARADFIIESQRKINKSKEIYKENTSAIIPKMSENDKSTQ